MQAEYGSMQRSKLTFKVSGTSTILVRLRTASNSTKLGLIIEKKITIVTYCDGRETMNVVSTNTKNWIVKTKGNDLTVKHNGVSAQLSKLNCKSQDDPFDTSYIEVEGADRGSLHLATSCKSATRSIQTTSFISKDCINFLEICKQLLNTKIIKDLLGAFG